MAGIACQYMATSIAAINAHWIFTLIPRDVAALDEAIASETELMRMRSSLEQVSRQRLLKTQTVCWRAGLTKAFPSRAVRMVYSLGQQNASSTFWQHFRFSGNLDGSLET
jgi:hypothetical protein